MKRLLTAFLLCATVAPLASAAAMKTIPSFKQADKNGDNIVTIQEAVAAGIPRAIAKKNDLNGDGKLTSTDWILVRYDVENAKSDNSAANHNG